MVNLNPTVRWLLAGLLGGATAAVSILADGFQALDVLLIGIALGGALGLVPPQTGGTQEGVVSPSVTEPPAADITERGYALVELAFALAVLLIGVAVLFALVD
jgi:hypothetical protein